MEKGSGFAGSFSIFPFPFFFLCFTFSIRFICNIYVNNIETLRKNAKINFNITKLSINKSP